MSIDEIQFASMLKSLTRTVSTRTAASLHARFIKDLDSWDGQLTSLPVNRKIRLFQEIAKTFTPKDKRVLRDLIPSLEQIQEEAIPDELLSVRTRNILQDSKITTWGSLSEYSPAQLMKLRHLGISSLHNLVSAAIACSVDVEQSVESESDEPVIRMADNLQVDSSNMTLLEAMEFLTPFLPETDSQELLASLNIGRSTQLANIKEGNLRRVTKMIAEYLAERPWPSLFQCIPYLDHIGGSDIVVTDALPVRVTTTLNEMGVITWNDMRSLSRGGLLDWRNFGKTSLIQLIDHAVYECFMSAKNEILTTNHSGTTNPSHAPYNWDDFHSSIGVISKWHKYLGTEITLEHLIKAPLEKSPPQDVRNALDFICSLSIPSANTPDEDATTVLSSLLENFDNKELLIFRERTWHVDGGLTLEDLGKTLQVTRERVRQIESRAIKRLNEYLESEDYSLLNWIAWSLRNNIGTAVPVELKFVGEQLDHATEIFRENKSIARLLILWLAGPYQIDRQSGWLCCDEIPTSKLVEKLADDTGRIDEHQLRASLHEIGLNNIVHDAWINHFASLREIRGQLYVWPRTIAEQGLVVLRTLGEPAPITEIHNIIGEQRALGSTANILYNDERFIRRSRNTIGLREWGGQQYSGVANLIEEVITESGGRVEVQQIVEQLGQNFSTRPETVRAYLSCPRFSVVDNIAAVRTSFDDYLVQDDISYTTNAYVHKMDTLAWRTHITEEMLRGSGSPFPIRIAGWLGLKPEDKVSYSSSTDVDEDITLTWPSASINGPSLGSIRNLISTLNCSEGEQILIKFNRVTYDYTCTRVSLNASNPTAKAACLVGLSPDSNRSQILEMLARTLGTTFVEHSIEMSLRRRGETDLVDLLFAQEERNGFEDAVKDLSTLL